MDLAPLRPLLALVLASAALPLHAEPDNSLNFGMGGFPRTMPHCDAKVYIGELEHAYSRTTSVLLRGTGVNYRFDNSDYQENGRINGVDLGARYYHAGGMEGLYFGGGIGYFWANWSFMHLAFPSLPRGTASSKMGRLNLEFGDRIRLDGTNISLMPEINIGKFFTSSSCDYTGPAPVVGTPCTQKSEVTGYWFVGLLAGVAF